MFQFKLPDLGEGIAEVEVVEWLVREGDVVQEDQPIADVQTDKARLEISSPRAGRVHRLCAKGGDILPVGQILIEIDDGVESAAAPGTARPESDTGSEEALPAAPTAAEEPRGPAAPAGPPPREPSPPPERSIDTKQPPRMPPRPQARPAPASPGLRRPAEAVPPVRELAKQLGVDIEQVPGTGPEGRVMRRDVEAFHAELKRGGPIHAAVRAAPEEPALRDEPDWTRRPLRGVRRLIAERMVRSKSIIPHYTFVEEVDVTVLEDMRKALAEAAGQEKISPLAFIAHAAVRVLPRFPQMNACLDEKSGEMIYKAKIHLGIAVATDEGLMVPVIRDAAGRSVAELAAMIRDLSERARANRLDPPALKGATFAVTSLGKLGGLMATPIIHYPASAILGVHAIRTLPRYVGSRVQPRKLLNLSVSLDHRIVDGFEGARFVQEVKAILEQADFPEFK
ncbi:MAG: 2-oxo acid dehydrogenase subunit E2 [candidate division NC10 bacterium]|nr:2-oxo acid dehydrogenase subunit E2 [candidate division NC10 bacterium]